MNKLVACCVITLASACLQVTVDGRSDGGEVPADAGTATVYLGVVHHTCAPTGSPALTFTLSNQAISCSQKQSEGFFVTMNVGQVRAGDTFSLPEMASACQCGVIANRATQGVVVIDGATDAGVTGHLNATFGTGGKIEGLFNVVVCQDGTVLCG